MIFIAFIVSIAVAVGSAGYACFKYGYALGWQERHDDMVLPRNIVARTNRSIDDNDIHHRHSAIDPKKPVWK